jgi:hypothetical protein
LEKVKNYKNYILQLISFVLALVTLRLFSFVLLWNESRSGYFINDIVLDHVGPYENHIVIFLLTYGLLLFGLSFSLRTKQGWIATNFSVVFFLVFRTLTLAAFPLNPPEHIIPLKDLFLTNTFYGNKVLVRDLFFSGHTCAVFLLYYLVDNKIVKRILMVGGTLLGSLLILQHVHYTIDVIVAPLIAYIVFKCGVFVQKKSMAIVCNDDKMNVAV